MRSSFLPILLLALGLPAFGFAENDPDELPTIKNTGMSLPQHVEEMIRASLSAGLLDPKAAVFSELTGSFHKNKYYFCGKINVRNLSGAYIGNTVFLGFWADVEPKFQLVRWGREPEQRAATLDDCEFYGIFLTRPLHWLQN